MSIYSSTHLGVILDDITLGNLNLQESDLRGYFSKEDLKNLLENNPACAGIRIYNVNPNTAFPALLAVGVLENGADLLDDEDQDTPAPITHLICNPTNDSSDRPQKVSRKLAFLQIKDGYSFDVMESEKFSSYFSRTMLQHLFDDNEHEGIGFYKVLWLAGRSTHLAVSSNLDSDTITKISGINGTDFSHCLSDQPCPGHCARMDDDDNEIIAPTPMASNPDNLQSHYIPIWD